MELITPAELARRTGMTRQAAHKAVAEGLIPHTLQGKRKMIDFDDPAVIEYTQSDSWQREVKPGSKSKDGQKKQPKIVNTSEDGEDLSPHEINRRTKIAEMRRKQMQVEILEKKFLPAEFIEDSYIRYLERLHSTLERSAGVFIQEVGSAILNSGEILPEHIERFTSLVLETIHNNKKAVKREVAKYEPRI